MKVLIFTTNKGNIYRPDEKGMVGGKAFLSEWLTGKIFVLCCGDGKKFSEIMPYIKSCHGEIDFDFFAEEV